MPLTFPSHAAAVLPLKAWRPRWFDGVGLVAGSAAPDAWYLFLGLPPYPGDRVTHTVPALVWWCLPVGLLYTWTVRATAAVIAAHLPSGRRFAWRDYGVLGLVRHPFRITVASVLLGAASHLAWDFLTHNDGWVRLLTGVDWYARTGIEWWWVADLTSTVVGAGMVVAFAAALGRRRALRAWHGSPAATPVDPRRFWSVAGGVAVAGSVVVAVLPNGGGLATGGVRALHLAGFALVAGAVAVRRPARRSSRLIEPDSPAVPRPAAAGPGDRAAGAVAGPGDQAAGAVPGPGDQAAGAVPGPGDQAAGADPGGATGDGGVRIETMPGIPADEGDSRRDPNP